jgi:hypothetical protein
VTGENVWKALRYRSLIQVLSLKGDLIQSVPALHDVAGFRLTQRGHDLLKESGVVRLPFDKADLPRNMQFWLNNLRRLCRNCPKGLRLAYADGQLHILIEDTSGEARNDELHRLSSMKVPWLD